MTDKKRDIDRNQWDASSRNESQINFTPFAHYGNAWNNTNNPNWLNNMVSQPYRNSMLNDPQRVEKRNRVDDTNGNKKVMKDYPINPS